MVRQSGWRPLDGRRTVMRYVALLILLLPSMVFADGSQIINVLNMYNAAGAAAFCSACTGDQLFCWEITANNTTITSSGGCSVGSTTATASGSPEIVAAPAGKTGYAIYTETTNEFYYFTVTTRDIFDEAAFTVQFDVYFTGFSDGAIIFRAQQSATVNDVRVEVASTDELKVDYYGNSVNVSATTTAANLATSNWYTVTIKGRTSDLDPNLYIEVNGDSASSNTNLTAFTSSASQVRYGTQTGTAYCYIKNIKVWNTWQ